MTVLEGSLFSLPSVHCAVWGLFGFFLNALFMFRTDLMFLRRWLELHRQNLPKTCALFTSGRLQPHVLAKLDAQVVRMSGNSADEKEGEHNHTYKMSMKDAAGTKEHGWLGTDPGDFKMKEQSGTQDISPAETATSSSPRRGPGNKQAAGQPPSPASPQQWVACAPLTTQ